MKDKALKIVNLILALFLAIFSISYVFAWFADGTKVPLNLNGQASAYFASGVGSEEDPFIINNAQHIYNLAWLNNTGKFGTTKYYFKVAGTNDEPITIDMSGLVLPPIGTYQYPFLSDFNGNGSQIVNLQVSTDHDHITNASAYNSEDTAFSTAVGMFGQTASTATTIISSGTTTIPVSGENAESNVHDFILIDPKVEVSGNSADYNGDSNLYCAGLAVGYADGDVSNISIYDSSTTINESKTMLKVTSIGDNHFVTINSIIGGVGPNVNDDDLVGEDTSGSNISIFLPPEDDGDRILEYATIITSLNGYEPSQNRWTTDINNADTLASNGDDGLGFGNFFLTVQILQTSGSSDGMQFRSQGLSSFDLTYFGTDNTNEWRIIDAGFNASVENSYGELIRDKKNKVYSSELSNSLRYRSPAVKLSESSSADLYLDDESKIKNAVNASTGTTQISNTTAYNNLYLNAFLVNITEDNGSIFIAGSASEGTLTLKKLLTADEVKAALRLKAVQSLYSSDTEKYAEFADYQTTTNIFNSDGSLNQTLYDALINTNIDTLEVIDSKYFFAKNDYDILENVDFDNGTTILENFELGRRSSKNGQGIYFSLNKETSYLTYLDGATEKSVEIAGNSNAGPGLYVLYANEGTSNLDINYFKATGVSNGDAGNQGSSGNLTRIVRRVDFIYDVALPIIYGADTGYVHTNAIVTFTTSTSNSTIILGFNRYRENNDGARILNVYYNYDESAGAYTVTITSIPGTSSANFNDTATYNPDISFPDLSQIAS